MYDRFEGEVANLNVKGELVDPHPAGADQHLVVLKSDQTVAVDTEVGAWGSIVLFCPVRRQHKKINKYADVFAVQNANVEVSALPSGGILRYHP